MENKISNEELKQRMGWNIYQKIDHAVETISSFVSKYPNAVVSYSSGIDSELCLALARIVNKEIKGRMVNTTNEHSVSLKHARSVDNVEIVLPETTFTAVVEKYGFPLISKKVCRMVGDIKHPTDRNANTVNLYKTGYNQKGEYHAGSKLSKRWWKLIDAPFDISNKCCYYLKERVLDSFKNPNIIGTMTSDSQWRKNAYLKTGCIDDKNLACKPISFFTKKDVWDAVKILKVNYNPIYDDTAMIKGEHNTGCCACGMGCHLEVQSRYERLSIREPKRFEFIMSIKNNGITFKDALIYCDIKSLRFLKNKQVCLAF